MLSFFFSPVILASTCDVFIHGYTSKPHKYFGDMPRQVEWNSNQSHQKAAPAVAKEILKQTKSCPKDSAIVVRAHSYGAAVIFYILGMGKRFQKDFPSHDFTKVYKMVTEVYSFTGAYSGTLVMNVVCGSKVIGFFAKLFGKPCVPALSTNPQFHVSEQVTYQGVPTNVIYSTNTNGYKNTLGNFLKFAGVKFNDIRDGIRNQNDSLLPQHSSLACAKVQVLTDPDQKCKKINSIYFNDFRWETEYSHNNFKENRDFMTMDISN
jgi:hypothetical protein